MNSPDSTGQQASLPQRRAFMRHAFAGLAYGAAMPVMAAIPAQQPPRPRVLLVSTNIDKVGPNASGTFLMEIAFPFAYFSGQGLDVDIVTPKGGKAALYHVGTMREDLARISQDKQFIDRTATTLSADQVDPAAYRAIYYPGGHGQYWDVVDNPKIASAAAAIYEHGGVVGSAGHGAASLTNIRLSSGKYLVENKRMTCFPWWAEKEFMDISGYGALLPFDMQEVLQRRKANLVVCTRETRNDKSLTIVADDANRLVTGSFASSAAAVAEHMQRIMLEKQVPAPVTARDGIAVRQGK